MPVVGPEVLAGSTRMKAGTAQKLVLNMISTTAMIQLGYVRGNRLSNMRARNVKLQARAVRILSAEASIDEAAAVAALERAGGDVATAIVMARTGQSRDAARRRSTPPAASSIARCSRCRNGRGRSHASANACEGCRRGRRPTSVDLKVDDYDHDRWR